MLQRVVLWFCIFGFCYYSLKVCLIIVFCLHSNIYFQLVFFFLICSLLLLCALIWVPRYVNSLTLSNWFCSIIYCWVILSFPLASFVHLVFDWFTISPAYHASFSSNTTIDCFIIYIDGYMFWSLDSPQVKTQNKVTCSGNNAHVTRNPIQLAVVLKYRVIQKGGLSWTVNGASTHARQLVAVFQVLC